MASFTPHRLWKGPKVVERQSEEGQRLHGDGSFPSRSSCLVVARRDQTGRKPVCTGRHPRCAASVLTRELVISGLSS
jgi:hypothetical protein